MVYRNSKLDAQATSQCGFRLVAKQHGPTKTYHKQRFITWKKLKPSLINQVISSYTIFFKKRLSPQPVALHFVRKIAILCSFVHHEAPARCNWPSPKRHHNFASGSPSRSFKSSSVAPWARPSPNCAFFSGLGFPQNHRVDYQERFFFMTFFWGWGMGFSSIYSRRISSRIIV